jgi:hypothetical protein
MSIKAVHGAYRARVKLRGEGRVRATGIGANDPVHAADFACSPSPRRTPLSCQGGVAQGGPTLVG